MDRPWEGLKWQRFLNKKDGSKLPARYKYLAFISQEWRDHPPPKSIKDTVRSVCSPQMLVGAHKRRSTLFNYCQAIREDTWSDSRVEGTKRFGGGEFVLLKMSKCQQARGKCHACVCMSNSTWKEQKCNLIRRTHTHTHTHRVCGSQI